MWLTSLKMVVATALVHGTSIHATQNDMYTSLSLNREDDDWIDVGFGTAGLYDSYQVVTMALEEGFRKFDTAEANVWYDQANVGRALHDYFVKNHDKNATSSSSSLCRSEGLQVSTKIPPWSLTSHYDIRRHAADSRQELLGFCEHWKWKDDRNERNGENEVEIVAYPLDVYYIHAPACWTGWHPNCQNPPETLLELKSAWLAMEAIVGHDRTARRIGVSNVHPPELRELIRWIQERKDNYDNDNNNAPPSSRTEHDGLPVPPPPPRLPDAVQIYADPIHPAQEVRQICREHQIEFVSYSTLGTQHRRSRNGENPVLDNPLIQQLATKYERSTAEIVLQWARQEGMSVIPRSNQRGHIQQLARLLELSSSSSSSFQLTPEDMQRIRSLENAQ